MIDQLKYFLIIALTFWLMSCGGKDEIPAEVIPKEKMIDVMTEIELTQALIKLKYSTQDTINEQQIFNEVYTDFDISEEKFNVSITYYCKDPKLLMNMYIKVMENLTKKQSEQQRK
ncbi:MAG: DUF4296 domain-containing protein [Vicingaceae bacterium]|nr:DUF4296 domain-containing protein [Vicingaceae bacterium]